MTLMVAIPYQALFLLINTSLININLNESINLTVIQEQNKVKKVYREILHNLEEGIILLG